MLVVLTVTEDIGSDLQCVCQEEVQTGAAEAPVRWAISVAHSVK
jgi:hypothetical protein